MKDATSRSFKGGLNVADSQLNLTSKYATILDNLVVGIDGSITIRQGTRLFADTGAVGNSYNIAGQYFAGNLIVINHFGQLFRIDGQGNVQRIWDQDIATAKRVGLTIWAPCDFVTFLEFNGQLQLHNGQDKPLTMGTNLIVDYLADVTGSNINVPIGKIVEKHQNHVIVANGSILNVSERNAGGTWTGDSGAQFTGIFDMKTYVTKGDTEVIGLLSFKTTLLVMFRECTVPVVFVETPADATAGTPASLSITVPEPSAIPNYGAISPKSLQNLGDDALALDVVGVASESLSTFTRILSPDRPSRLVDPLLQGQIGSLSTDALYNDTFSVYDRRLGTYMLFFPDNVSEHQLKSVGFNYRYIDNLDIKAWTTNSGWSWHWGASSSEGNMFFGRNRGTEIFVMGNAKTNPLSADFIGEQEMFDDDTPFTDQTGFNPVANVDDSGVPIKWIWEFPWSDLKNRMHVKTLRYIAMDTEGSAEFDILVFVDDLYYQYDPGEEFSDLTMFTDGSGFSREYPLITEALRCTMVGKDRGGFGGDGYGNIHGGGNNTTTRRLTEMPTKFNTMKLRMEGESTLPLKFVAVSLLYQQGSIRRMSND